MFMYTNETIQLQLVFGHDKISCIIVTDKQIRSYIGPCANAILATRTFMLCVCVCLVSGI
jgi:hypothetical protein